MRDVAHRIACTKLQTLVLTNVRQARQPAFLPTFEFLAPIVAIPLQSSAYVVCHANVL